MLALNSDVLYAMPKGIQNHLQGGSQGYFIGEVLTLIWNGREKVAAEQAQT